MAQDDDDPDEPTTQARGLLITADPALARAFRNALQACDDCTITFDLQGNLDEARRAGGGCYQNVTIDLDGSFVADQAVRQARDIWPDARIAVLSHWWSEREGLDREEADVVIHKPLRAAELQAVLRSPTGAPTAASQKTGAGAATTVAAAKRG